MEWIYPRQYKIRLQSFLVFEFAGVVDGAIESWGFSSERFIPVLTGRHEALSTTSRFDKADEIVASIHIRFYPSINLLGWRGIKWD